MHRRNFLKAGAVLMGGLGAGDRLAGAVADGRGGNDRPDVVFIACEDLQTSLRCYGNPVVQTPNLDAMATRGLRFDNAHCQFSVCNPSRASVMSGRYPASVGVLGNATDWREPLRNIATIPEHFRAHGYETMRCGKIFHGGNAGRVFDDKDRWDRVIPQNEGIPSAKRKRRPLRALYENMSKEERAKEYTTRAWEWGPSGLDDLEMPDGRVAEQAVRQLSGKHDKPLFLALGFHSPHLVLTAPDKYFDMYSLGEIRLPENPENDLDDVSRYSLRNHKQFTDEKRREAILAYYACCSYVDAGVGRVLKALEDSGRIDNTIVVFWGDHGFHLGEHFLWQKHTLFEESTRVPLIMMAPGVTRAGTACTRPVELIDLYPTLCELCGLPMPEGLESISMVPLLRDPDRKWKKGAFTTLGPTPGNSVRTERWRYTEWGGPDKAELYDHESDPHEFTNLAKVPRYAATVEELGEVLRGGWRAALPEE